ncbi:response regulator [Gelidibacter maritimus]|uniref:histidine kinase n=1 Tax=Gelidibacter maritimus TaxID=2761487 RepID=A0A7W2M6C4_9FLAO|nr:response regulator [Gelidibacter maritimus]MBA6153526.1 response regulator [Gelidibacter maritimus]
MNLLKSFLILIATVHISDFGYSQSTINQNSVTERLKHSINATDSIYQKTLLLNEEIAHAKSNHLPLSLANTLRTLGDVYSSIESHETAALHYTKAYRIYDSLKKPQEIDDILTVLAHTYVDGKKYEKFDSLIPIALRHSKQLNSINHFYNLESKVRRNYFVKQYDLALRYSEIGLQQLDKFEFSTEKNKKEKINLVEVFRYYQSLALINLKQYDKGYELLFKLNPEEFQVKGNDHLAALSQTATLNYYKFRYYNEREKQLDSATKYLLISDSLKYIAIKKFQERLSDNGNLIYKIISTEKQLQLANVKREHHRVTSNAFLMSTIILSLLLTVLATFFYYYYNNRKRIKTINLRLKESNRKLKIIDKERLEFFSILSHELRTPIYGINGLATLIDQEKNPKKSKTYLNALLSSSHYISVLIDNVLQISTVKFEKKSLHLKPTNILELIKRVSSSIKISADQKGLKLYTNIEKTNWGESLLVDNVVLSQILINLTYNAIRYTSKGFVAINITEQRRTDTHVNLLFEIKDSGIGIKNKHRDLIFNAFENKTFLEKNSTGSGLGLYIVKTLLKSYDAEIKFLSKVNEGSTFYFDIDFEIAAASIQEQEEIESFTDVPSKILIVDDNTINLMVTKKNVEKIPGCFSETATHGREAICLVKDKDFDLVLMDINMPDMDGYEATKHIRLFNPDIPILALTALNSDETKSKAMACGMNHVITKPYDFEEFQSIVLKYCQTLQAQN